jgi:hypothetical protein
MSPQRDSTRPSMQDAQSPIAYLRSPSAIRQRCEDVLRAGLAGELTHFRVVPEALPQVVARVARVTRRRYPSLDVPWPSRLDRLRLGGHDRLAPLRARMAGDPDELARVLFEVAIISILLGAGAGSRWRYHEKATGIAIGRTEGLALASFHAYAAGIFSSVPGQPLRADADALDVLDAMRLARALDVRSDNPMDGLGGRTELMSQLGSAMRAASHLFGDEPRLGRLFDAMKARSGTSRTIPARRMLAMILEAFSPIWPSRCTVMGVHLGDVWPHPAAGGSGPGAGLVPFHTFAQWMTYSLIPVLEGADVRVEGVGELAGMTEYRTCGLFVDDGVLVPRHEAVTRDVHDVGAEVIVEWRALSLALLDRLGRGLREELFGHADAGPDDVLPAACVIEGGTWAAGREAAKERRADGSPPIQARTDGTVF